MHCKLKCCVYTVLVFNAKQYHYNQVHFRGAPPTFPTPHSCNFDETINCTNKLFDSYVYVVGVMSVIVFSSWCVNTSCIDQWGPMGICNNCMAFCKQEDKETNQGLWNVGIFQTSIQQHLSLKHCTVAGFETSTAVGYILLTTEEDMKTQLWN